LFLLCSNSVMEHPLSRPAPSTGPESEDSASPFNVSSGADEPVFASPAEAAAYRAGIAEGLRRASAPLSPDPGDRLAFVPVPLRHRSDGLTPQKQREFVEALADCGVVSEAAARIGVTEQSINRVRRRSDAWSFNLACEAAHRMGARHLRSIAYERAIRGTIKGHYYHGELKSEERVFDNRLLIYLLGKTEHLLEPPQETQAVCHNWEPFMDALEQGLPPPDPIIAEAGLDDVSGERVWQEKDGEWRTTFPPPDGFEGHEEGVCNGVDWYCRALTPREQTAVEPMQSNQVALDRSRRDRFFGFAGGGDSSPKGPELSEPSEPFAPGDPGPLASKPPPPGILEDEPPGESA
jgi:hypothetical protein